MPKIVVLGAGIGGISMAYELRAKVGRQAEIIVVSDSEWFHFVPSNPWVALRWRKPEEIKVHLPERPRRSSGIGFDATGARRVLAAENALELNDGRRLSYDYLVIATGPALAFDEVPGLGPDGQQPLDLPCRPCGRCGGAVGALLRGSRPHRDRRRAGCVLLRAGLRVRADGEH